MFTKVLRLAIQDGKISADEDKLLRNLRKEANIGDDEFEQVSNCSSPAYIFFHYEEFVLIFFRRFLASSVSRRPITTLLDKRVLPRLAVSAWTHQLAILFSIACICAFVKT